MNLIERTLSIERHRLTLVIILLTVTGFAYLGFRFGSGDASTFCKLTIYGLVCWLSVFWLLQSYHTPSTGGRSLLLIGVIATAIPIVIYMSHHFWDGLAVYKDGSGGNEVSIEWNIDGTSTLRTNLPLSRFHISGDEAAHLAAVAAVAEHGLDPRSLRAVVQPREGYNSAYWIHRSLHAHPIGLHIAYLPAANSPPFARIIGSLVFLLAIATAFWAGQCLDRENNYGLFCAVMFASVPNLFWWHGFRVSSDVLPCIPSFLATGYCWAATLEKENVPRLLKTCGIFLAFACAITHTASLAAAALLPIVWRGRKTDIWRNSAWVFLPATLATTAGIGFSSLIVGPENHCIIGRFFDISPGAESFNGQGKDFIWMLKGLPRNLGLPMLGWLLASVAMFTIVTLRERFRVLDLVAAMTVLIPATCLFWSEIRYTYPGWLIVITGLGGQLTWRRLTFGQRSGLLATLVTSTLVKFVFLRNEIATASY